MRGLSSLFVASSSLSPLSLPASRLFTSTTRLNYFAVHVSCLTKPGTAESFKIASLMNARSSSLEPGVLRFDVLQSTSDENRFTLVEVYKDSEASPAAHKETAHYLAWREAVAEMMERPREAEKFETLFPATEKGWAYPEGEKLE